MQPLIVEPREVKLSTRTEISVRRLIPHAKLRRVGAWVFLDHFGPTPQVDGMQVARHPHAGLQTVTWLFEGEVDHRDSIGSRQLIRPGQLNLMTAGRAVAHSEKSRPGSLVATERQSLHAVQLWLALPNSVRQQAPSFEHLESVPTIQLDAMTAQVFIGAFAGIESPARVFSPLVGAELVVRGRTWLPLRSGWQHALVIVEGSLAIAGEIVANRDLAYLEPEVATRGVWLDLPAGTEQARVILIGGEPFAEEIVMWWNFIARTSNEIVALREQWNAQSEPASPAGMDALAAYPPYSDELGGWIPAPELPNVTLRPRR
jgi:redox-sensitive bicupin YhaK (pirin superfamily)